MWRLEFLTKRLELRHALASRLLNNRVVDIKPNTTKIWGVGVAGIITASVLSGGAATCGQEAGGRELPLASQPPGGKQRGSRMGRGPRALLKFGIFFEFAAPASFTGKC